MPYGVLFGAISANYICIFCFVYGNFGGFCRSFLKFFSEKEFQIERLFKQSTNV